ncbi:diacylglycerol kinase family protein [Demequina sp. NBRC 110056]|uniref:diacylglycerol/lipid kinase family protein n=1 Tax=Demequina sp. NBRC 110056 TaxID=1570345 RepID=UPI0009FC7663|nr:diacylglycerol kinase family protein [Demequina sp. NBRC 110056]
MTTLGVITNPTAGSGRGQRWGAEALALLAARGHRVRDLSRGTWAASLEEARGRHRDLDALVVVGGDGMVHLGVQACAGTRLPLGIVAAGSGNDAASSLGLPIHDVQGAVDAIERGLDGDVARIDLGRIDGPGVADRKGRRYFSAVLSMGIDAAIAASGNRMRHPRGPLKYKVATLKELPRFRPYGVRIEADGEAWEQTCTLIAVANGPVFGGGLCISRDSSLVDGMLEVVVAEAVTRRRILQLFPKLYDGSVIDEPEARVIRARRVRIGPAGPSAGHPGDGPAGPAPGGAALPAAFADGELVGPAPLDIRAEPGALRVLGGRPDSLRA